MTGKRFDELHPDKKESRVVVVEDTKNKVKAILYVWSDGKRMMVEEIDEHGRVKKRFANLTINVDNPNELGREINRYMNDVADAMKIHSATGGVELGDIVIHKDFRLSGTDNTELKVEKRRPITNRGSRRI